MSPAMAQQCPPVEHDKQKTDQAACRAAGGEWSRFGVLAHLCNVYSCAARTRDGGKPCLGQGDCEFRCVSKRELPLGTPVTGECAAVVTQFGCTVHVEGGRVAGRICID
jgi:hypothetical protein